MSTPAQRRRAAKKQRKQRSITIGFAQARIPTNVLLTIQTVDACARADARELVVCDRCGTVQPYRHAVEGEELAACVGPLGLPCAGETCTTLDDEEARR